MTERTTDPTASVAVLVPIKRFSDAKQRLAGALAPAERQRLARSLAAGVLAATESLPRFVACDDDDVADFARAAGATVVWTPGLGLNGAVDAGLRQICDDGHAGAIVAHADLAHPERLVRLADPDAFILVSDRRGDGTNAVAIPAAALGDWAASYGPRSFGRHVALATELARRHGVALEVRRDPLLALDVDTPADLRHPEVRPRVSALLAESAAAANG